MEEKLKVFESNAGPTDAEWKKRLKEEYIGIISYIQYNKSIGNDWVTLNSNAEGTRWSGTCSITINYVKHSFAFEIEIPIGYPRAPPELCIPSLKDKTVKMYRGGFICLSAHFAPLWVQRAPKVGLGHLLSLCFLSFFTF